MIAMPLRIRSTGLCVLHLRPAWVQDSVSVCRLRCVFSPGRCRVDLQNEHAGACELVGSRIKRAAASLEAVSFDDPMCVVEQMAGHESSEFGA